ncbi:hypothetical protein ACFX13_039248 [Malus domestica]
MSSSDSQAPNFNLSRSLAVTDRYQSITLLYTEPADSHKPDVRTLLRIASSKIHVFGRETRVADIPTFHPSCSKQHAIVQFRRVEESQVRPYLIDLGSTNRTYINGSAIEPQMYYELVEKDTIRFGNSSREYVLLHENSAAD